MQKYLVLAVLSLATLWGCASARMYPVKGPLASQAPTPVFHAKISAAFYSGTLSTTLNNGEHFRVPMSPAPTSGAPTHNLSAEWDSVFGPGYYDNRVLPAQFHLAGTATGSGGTVLEVELYKNEIRPVPAVKGDENNVRIDMAGVAKDSRGNVYKLTF